MSRIEIDAAPRHLEDVPWYERRLRDDFAPRAAELGEGVDVTARHDDEMGDVGGKVVEDRPPEIGEELEVRCIAGSDNCKIAHADSVPQPDPEWSGAAKRQEAPINPTTIA